MGSSLHRFIGFNGWEELTCYWLPAVLVGWLSSSGLTADELRPSISAVCTAKLPWCGEGQEAGASGKKIRRSNARPGASPSRWGKIIMEGCWIFGNYKEWLINRYVRLNPWKSLPNLVRGWFYARAADADRRLGVRRKSGAPMRLRTRLMYAGLTRNWPAMSFVGRPAWIWKTICFSRSPWGSHPFSVFTQPRFVSVIGINF
jgi:hypothetical protein